MASTRLVRKALRNRAVSRKRINAIKRLSRKPVIKRVDIEEIKEEFANKNIKPAAKETKPVKEKPIVEQQAEKKADIKEAAPEEEKAPKAETKAPEMKEAKKPEAKKVPAKKAGPTVKKEKTPKAEKKETKKEDKAE